MIVKIVFDMDDLFVGAVVRLSDGRVAEIVEEDDETNDVVVMIEDELESVSLPCGRPLFVDGVDSVSNFEPLYIAELLSDPERRSFDSEDEEVFVEEIDIFDEVFG